MSSRAFLLGPRLPLLYAVVEHERFTGLAFAQESALRRHVLLDARYIAECRTAGADGQVAQLVLHEELHGTVAALAAATPGSYADRLVCCVDEAATTVLELWATVAAEDARPTAAKLRRRAAGNCYRRQACALIDVLGADHPTDALAGECLGLAVRNLRAGCPTQTAAALSALAGERRDPAAWLDALGGPVR
jgi:hypothetical protein